MGMNSTARILWTSSNRIYDFVKLKVVCIDPAYKLTTHSGTLTTSHTTHTCRLSRLRLSKLLLVLVNLADGKVKKNEVLPVNSIMPH